MHQAHVLFFSIVTINLTLISVFEPGYYIGLLLSPQKGLLLMRLVVAFALLAYAFRQTIRTRFTQHAMRSFGVSLLILGAMTLFSPTFFGQFTSYLPIGETLLLIEGGILAFLLSLELSVQNHSPFDQNLSYLAALLAAQPRKLISAIRS
jgi:uncharacterized membrane protein